MADECSVRVVCRYRPHNTIEDAQGGQQVCSFPSEDSVKQNGRLYHFDRVFNPSTSQRELYREAAKPIVEDVLKGCNGTMFAYGQTSSGKTHTMEGVLGDDELCGVIPRIVEDIFTHIQHMDPGEAAENFFIKVSYFEIYMEKIRDLLNTSKTNLSIHEDKNRSPYVKDLTERYVATPQEVFEIIEEGKSTRHVSATNMNLHSSRSHSILLISVRQSFGGDKRTLNGKLYLVDLAGSEKVGKTGASGLTLDEAKTINKSLSALGNVISALTEAKGRSHVPYRDSKLTRILQESLGGNAKTTMVICCSPSSFNDLETKGTLDFGKRAKSIKNAVLINEELTAEEWKRRYEKEKEKNQKMKNVLNALQKEVKRWRDGESVPVTEQASVSASASTSHGGTHASPLSPDTASASGQVTGTASTGALGAGVGSNAAAMVTLSSDERQQFEEQRAKLYAELDEKDGEINTLGQELERLNMSNADLRELVDMSGRESAERLTNLNRFQQECEQNAEQVKEVLKALEDMALNYESKNQELDEKKELVDGLRERTEAIQMSLQENEMSLQSVKQQYSGARTQLQAVLNAWFQSLTEQAADLDGYRDTTADYQPPSADQVDESITSLKLFDSQLRSNLANTLQRTQLQEAVLRRTENELAARIGDISSAKLRLSRYEADASGYERNIVDLQESNQSLQSALDALSREMAAVSTAANAHANNSQLETKRGSEDKLESEKHARLLVQQHEQQISALRSELERTQGELKTSLMSMRHQDLESKHLQAEMLELRQIQRANMEKIAEFTMERDVKDKASRDTKVLREAVEKEATRLADIKKLFLATIAASKSGLSTTSESGLASAGVTNQKIAFLETNLLQITAAHKQLIQSHNELQREFSKQDGRVKAKSHRINLLETAITNIKQDYQEKKKQLTEQLDQIKKSYEARMKRGGVSRSTIVKAIRPGQALSTAATQQGSRPQAQHVPVMLATSSARSAASTGSTATSSSSSSSSSSGGVLLLKSPGGLATRSLRGDMPAAHSAALKASFAKSSTADPVRSPPHHSQPVCGGDDGGGGGDFGGEADTFTVSPSMGLGGGDVEISLSSRQDPVGVDDAKARRSGGSASGSAGKTVHATQPVPAAADAASSHGSSSSRTHRSRHHSGHPNQPQNSSSSSSSSSSKHSRMPAASPSSRLSISHTAQTDDSRQQRRHGNYAAKDDVVVVDAAEQSVGDKV